MRILEIPGFVGLVGFNSIPCALPDAEIDTMREALKSGISAEPCPYLTVGTRVEIRNGPLQGMSGILLRRRGQCRVVLSIDPIRRSLVVEVEAEDVMPVRASITPVEKQLALSSVAHPIETRALWKLRPLRATCS